MTIYIIAVILTAILAAIGSQNRQSEIGPDGTVRYAWSPLFTIPILLVWCFVFSFRSIYVGTDTPGYYRVYLEIWERGMTYAEFSGRYRDWLFGLLEYACCRLSHGNWIVFQLVVSALIYLPVICVAKKYASDVGGTLLIYMFTLQFFSGFNGMRQSLAVSFLVFSYYYFLRERKYLQFAVGTLIAFGFHSSVLLVIPLLLISTLGFQSRVVRWSALGLIVLYIFVWRLWPVIIRFLELIGQSKMAADYAEVSREKGSGFLRFVVAMVPFTVGFVFQDRLKEYYDNVDVELAVALFSGLFMLLSMRYWIFARVASYFSCCTAVFTPKLKNVFASDVLGRAAIIGLYFLYMIAILRHGEGGYYPYYFFA